MNTKNFEENLNDLELIVKALEDNQLPLETALQKFEEGVRLTSECQRKLQEAEQKIQIVLSEQNGSVLKDFKEE